MESPVAQWLEHPTRSRRVVGSNPIWDSDFSESAFLVEFLNVEYQSTFLLEFTYYHVVVISLLPYSLRRLVGRISIRLNVTA